MNDLGYYDINNYTVKKSLAKGQDNIYYAENL